MYKNKKMPVIVAELSGNHNGSLNRAIELMELAHECGADAVKIQTYTEDSLTLDSDRSEFKLEGGRADYGFAWHGWCGSNKTIGGDYVSGYL